MSVPLLSVQKGSYGPASTLISCKLLFVLGLPARLQGVPRLPHPHCRGAGELWLLLLARADEGPGGAGSQQPPLSQHGNNSGVRGRVVAARGGRARVAPLAPSRGLAAVLFSTLQGKA